MFGSEQLKGPDMNKFVVSLVAIVAAIIGSGAVASAQYGATDFGVVVSPTTVGSSGAVTVTVQGCAPGETLVVTLVGESVDVTCMPSDESSGTATGVVAAPSAAGTYTGTVASSASSNSATFTVTVVAQAGTPSGALPQTGSDGIATTTTIALGLVAVGVGMLVVTQIRRRRLSLG